MGVPPGVPQDCCGRAAVCRGCATGLKTGTPTALGTRDVNLPLLCCECAASVPRVCREWSAGVPQGVPRACRGCAAGVPVWGLPRVRRGPQNGDPYCSWM